jgi:hypothetical protein
MSRTRAASRRRRRRGSLVALFLFVALAACGGGGESTAPATPSIAGHWKGSALLGQVQFEATFTQAGEVVGGNGEFTSPLGSGPFTVAGTLRGQDVELGLTSTEFGATTYTGRFVTSDRITGHLEAPGYSDLELTLERD